MSQTNYNVNLQPAVPGGLGDLAPRYVMSYVNQTANKDTWTVTVGTAANAAYSVTVDGVVVSFNEGATGTTTSKAAGLAAAINANSTLNQRMRATAAAAVYTITALNAGYSFVVAGQDANQGSPSQTVTLPSATNIPFGVAVAQLEGTNSSEQCKLPASTGDVLLGIAIFDQTQFNLSNANAVVSGSTLLSTNVGYLVTATVGVIRKGTVWVLVENAVTAEAAVYVRVTANGALTQLGAIRADTDSGNAIALTGAKFITGAAAGGLAMVLLG